MIRDDFGPDERYYDERDTRPVLRCCDGDATRSHGHARDCVRRGMPAPRILPGDPTPGDVLRDLVSSLHVTDLPGYVTALAAEYDHAEAARERPIFDNSAYWRGQSEDIRDHNSERSGRATA
ncbi:MAG: hypothetical protein JJE50_01540 [Actinomycetales bacterium]|nr:hypothetical protein [Actinomycetales bacterium]